MKREWDILVDLSIAGALIFAPMAPALAHAASSEDGGALAGNAKASSCVPFEQAANIRYIPAVWNEKHGAYESVFEQLSDPGERGWVEDVNRSGELYVQGKADPIVTFPMGADVTGYHDTTTQKTTPLPDGTSITSYTTVYCSDGTAPAPASD
jgi:hypothetical protein